MGLFTNPMIMGVLNITPDSFSDGGKYLKIDHAINKAQKLIREGADIIDIGGESTRPGATKVSVKEESQRVISVISALTQSTTVPISIDTSKAEIMHLAVKAGASIINDVRALQSQDTLATAASLNTNVCLMHMQCDPQTMQKKPTYVNVVDEIKHFFEKRITACIKAGIQRDNIILDPGFGFGKTLAHNLKILKHFSEFNDFGLRVLAGISRKTMIGSMLNGRNVDARMVGSVTGAIIAAQNGASIVRVHDVLATKDALTVLQQIARS